jgi:hypothetical protein
MLSLMVNPASPPLLSVSEEDHKAAQRYRLYIVYRLPGLQFLDSAPITAREREEAKAQVCDDGLACRSLSEWLCAGLRAHVP